MGEVILRENAKMIAVPSGKEAVEAVAMVEATITTTIARKSALSVTRRVILPATARKRMSVAIVAMVSPNFPFFSIHFSHLYL